MNDTFFAFGEMLWDCLPSGRHAGGAPFNVAAHWAQLGVSAALISAVGQDELGREILEVARHKNVDTRFVSQARADLPTGVVLATTDGNGNATYDIVQPSAWDEIRVPQAALDTAARGKALVYGSLSCRSPHNLEQLARLLALEGPTKCFDVNLRPPFADLALVIQLAQRADVMKLNHEEAGRLAAWVKTGRADAAAQPADARATAEACAALSDATNTPCLCVTRGAAGAVWWERSKEIVVAEAPKTTVKDTVGAGDAFMAGLTIGLTQRANPQSALEAACRLGAYVASHDGATPLLSPEMAKEIKEGFQPA